MALMVPTWLDLRNRLEYAGLRAVVSLIAD